MRRYAGECFRRIRRLYRKFRQSFRGYVSATIVYDPGSRIFIISAFNEYGDSAYLSEDMMETRSPVRSIWPGEVMDSRRGIKWWGWSKRMRTRMVVLARLMEIQRLRNSR
jgi:hypothetical protein